MQFTDFHSESFSSCLQGISLGENHPDDWQNLPIILWLLTGASDLHLEARGDVQQDEAAQSTPAPHGDSRLSTITEEPSDLTEDLVQPR